MTVDAAREHAARGRDRLQAGDADGALEAARAGLEALGPPPPGPGPEDDTDLKLLVAEDRVEQGHPRDGARMMLEILEIRADLREQALSG